MRLALLFSLLALTSAARAQSADAPDDDTAQMEEGGRIDDLIRGGYQEVLGGTGFRFRFSTTFTTPDTVLTSSGTATTYAEPPEGITRHRLDYDSGPVAWETFDGVAYLAASPRTQRVYTDSTGADVPKDLGLFLRFHPTLSLGLHNLYQRASDVDGPTLDAVDGVPCETIRLAFSDSTAVSACIDPETRFPLRIAVALAQATYEVLYSAPDAIPVPDASTFSPPLPPGYTFAPYDSSGRARLGVGDTLPEFEVTTSDGATVRLSDFRGRVVLLDLWGTWCAPCVEALPHVGRLARDLPGLAVLGLAAYEDDAADPAAFARARGVDYPIARISGETAEALTAFAFPTYLVVGPDGTILFRAEEGQGDGFHARLGAFLRSVLAL